MSQEIKGRAINYSLTRNGVTSKLTLSVNGQGPELQINGKPQAVSIYRRDVYHQVAVDPDGRGFVKAEDVGIEYYDEAMERKVEISIAHVVPFATALLRMGRIGGVISTIGDESKFGGTYVLKKEKAMGLGDKVNHAFFKIAFALNSL